MLPGAIGSARFRRQVEQLGFPIAALEADDAAVAVVGPFEAEK